MTKKWEVHLQAVILYTIEVEAEDEAAAHAKARAIFNASDDHSEFEDGYDDVEVTDAQEIIKV